MDNQALLTLKYAALFDRRSHYKFAVFQAVTEAACVYQKNGGHYQVPGEDFTVSVLVFSVRSIPSHWRSDFIVMVTVVCIIHAGVVVTLKTSSSQETRWVRPAQLLVTLSVCVTDIDAGLVTEYTRDSFLFAVWPVLIALCIARHLMRPRSRPLEMASSGTGQSNKEPVIWYWSSKEMSAALFVPAVVVFLPPPDFTIFILLLFFLLNTSSHFLPELLTCIEAHKAYLAKASKQTETSQRNMNRQFVFVCECVWSAKTYN